MTAQAIDVPRGTIPPTEAEIREAIRERSDYSDSGATVYEITKPAVALWADLRPSEAARLEDLMNEIYKLADDFESRVVEAVVAAGLTFAAEYPDAPRARLGDVS